MLHMHNECAPFLFKSGLGAAHLKGSILHLYLTYITFCQFPCLVNMSNYRKTVYGSIASPRRHRARKVLAYTDEQLNALILITSVKSFFPDLYKKN